MGPKGPRGYKEKYPADECYKEAGPDARVWQVYNHVSKILDTHMLDDYSSNLDILLIFVRI